MRSFITCTYSFCGIKSRRIGMASGMCKRHDKYHIPVAKADGRPFGRPKSRKESTEMGCGRGVDSGGSGLGPLVGDEFLNQLSDHQLLKKSRVL
jgi:hypothetical protein